MNEDKVTPFPTVSQSNGGGHNGSRVHLAQIEKRVENLEKAVQETRDLCIEIKTRMENIATKEYVMRFTVFLISFFHAYTPWTLGPALVGPILSMTSEAKSYYPVSQGAGLK